MSGPNTSGNWYKVEVTSPRCQRCGAKATCKVYNSANALIGDFCKRHAEIAVKTKSV
jgi:hypothetical protein